jgi:HSP20 family protein
MPTFSRDPFGELVHEFNRVQDEVNRLFGYRLAGGGLPVNLWADEHNLYVEADLPAMAPAKLDVSVTEGNKLTVSGERLAPTVEGAVWVRQERPVGKFSREVTLPVLVDPDKVEATYEHGVLKLTLPKHEAAKPRKITVKA